MGRGGGVGRVGRARGRGTSHAPPVAHAQVSLTGSTRFPHLMGLYELCDAKAPSGSVMYVNHNAGDDDVPKRYLYRTSNDGKWKVAARESWIARNVGDIISDQSDADLPTAAGLTWNAIGLVVTEVRLPRTPAPAPARPPLPPASLRRARPRPRRRPPLVSVAMHHH